MSKELTVSVSLKSGPKKVPYAAVEYKDGEQVQTIVYKAGTRHLNEMFADVLNLAILKDIKSVAENYDHIQLNLNRNKFSKLIEDGQPIINERDIDTVKKAESIYNHLLDIKSKTNIGVSFEHSNIANIYNEVLSYDKLSDYNEQQKGIVFGDLVIAEGERFDPKKFGIENLSANIENNKEEVSSPNLPTNKLSAFIDVVKSENDSNIFYIGVAMTKKEENSNTAIFSHIIPIKAENEEQALTEQLRKVFFKGENKRQQSSIHALIEKEDGLNVYCSAGNSEIIKSIINESFKEDFSLNITDKLGNSIRDKILQKINNDESLRSIELNDSKKELVASEIYNDKNKMAVYISTSSNEIGQSYGIVIRAPASDEVLYEIEGKVNGDIINDQIERDRYAANEALKYIAGKVRNGHLPKDMSFEVRTNNLPLVSMISDGSLKLLDNDKIKKDISENISFSWVNDKHLDPYISCSKDVARNARKMISSGNIVQSVEFENKEAISSIKNNKDYTFNSKAKKLKKS